MSEIGDFLKRLRGKISLRDAAARSGLSHSYIASLEKGKHPNTGAPITPSPESLFALSKAYNYPYEDLLRVAGIIPTSSYDNLLKNPDLDTKKQMILNEIDKSFDTLTEEDKEHLLYFVKKMTDSR